MGTGLDDEARARVIIGEILDFALNRHIHSLERAGFLRARSYRETHGWSEGVPGLGLQIKHDLIDEVCKRFGPVVADYLKYPREFLWPVHDLERIQAIRRDVLPESQAYLPPHLISRRWMTWRRIIARWLPGRPKS